MKEISSHLQHLVGFHQRGKSMVKGIRVMERMKVCYYGYGRGILLGG